MKRILLFVCAVMILGLCGCGSETSGSLSVSAPANSNGIVTATATYAPASGSAMVGQIISFRWYTVGVTSKLQSSEITVKYDTNTSGSATSQYILPTNRVEDVIVYVSASTAGLTNKEGWQSIVVPQ